MLGVRTRNISLHSLTMCIFSLFAVNASTHLSIGRRAQFSNPVSQVRMITTTLLKWARERSEAVFCNHCRVVVCLLQLAAAVLWISMRSCHLNTPLSATPPVSPSFLSAPLHLCIHLSASYTPPPRRSTMPSVSPTMPASSTHGEYSAGSSNSPLSPPWPRLRKAASFASAPSLAPRPPRRRPFSYPAPLPGSCYPGRTAESARRGWRWV